jgi:MYXO-CTERM domain-containing protein
VANNGRAEWFLLDSSVVSTPSAPANAQVGGIAPIAASQYTGSVRGDGGTTDNSTLNPPSGGDVTFNPDYNEGALVCLNAYNYFQAGEWAVQDTSVGWGHTVEPNGVNTVAKYANARVTFGGYSQTDGEGFGYLDRSTVSGGTLSDVYRYVWAYHYGGNDTLRIAHVDASGFSTAPTDLTTGTRNVEQRAGTGGYTLLTPTELYALGPAGCSLNGLAVRGEVGADVFDIYMLLTDATSTNLVGIQATVPSDGSAMSYDVIDLDAEGPDTYLQLMDTAAGADVEGTALVWDPTGSTLYVAAYLDYSEGNAYDTGRIYIFDKAEPIPEPAGLGLVLLGLPLLRRRRH